MKYYHSNLFKQVIFFLFIFGASNSISAQSDLQAEVNAYLQNLPFKMLPIKAPVFQDKTFNISGYGAVGDGQTLNTTAIRNAIEACAGAGGGSVIIPKGLWLTGPIELKSNVNLHADRGALIIFTPDHKEYPIIKFPHRGFEVASPIYGADLENVALTGDGIFDGAGDTWRPVKKAKTTESQWKSLLKSGGVVDDKGTMWWPTKEAMDGAEFIKNLKKNKKKLSAEDFLPARDFLRPNMIFLINCKNVLIDGITVKNTPKFSLYPTLCDNLIIRDVKVNNEWWAQNGDGIDINTSKNVLVCKCTVNAGDDGICMKSSNYGNTGEPLLQNIVIRDNTVYHAHGGFVIGSNIDGGIKNIYVENCDFVNTDVGLRFKSARGRGAVAEDIYISNIYMKDISNEAILFDTYYEQKANRSDEKFPVNERTPVFKNFFMNNIYCEGARQAVLVMGLPEMPVQGINITNSVISAGKGFSSKFAEGFTLENVRILPEIGNVFSLNESSNFVIDNGYCPPGTNVFMSVEGKGSVNIKIVKTDLSGAKSAVEYGADADHNSVIQQ
jgi:polygalacturonase